MIRHALYALSMMTAFVAPAYASGLTATQSVQRMVVTEDTNGSEKVAFVAAETVAPGDRVFFSIDYVNDNDTPAANVQFVMPVPVEIAYVENSATGSGANVAFSADGGKTFAPRGELSITVDGQARMALAEEISHIRWTFSGDIAAGAIGDVGYLGLLK